MHLNLPDKLYYKIGEIAKAFNVKTSLIRYWEKEFKTLHPKKNKNGSRLFTKKDVESLKHIYHLVKEKGFTLEGAKQKIKDERKLGPEQTSGNQSVISRLEMIKNELIQIKNQL
ncbi:MAG TPA: MerR family transcriptional regulator [Lutibacter sp.]|nr:MerR family transcriptional regulator [Lutibacter sp.]